MGSSRALGMVSASRSANASLKNLSSTAHASIVGRSKERSFSAASFV